MKSLRKILFPFSILYDGITRVRNYMYDSTPEKSTAFVSIPLIAVGNLSVGGTGKTPMIEYLVRLLQDRYRIATLSRGYKRKSQGFQLATADSTAEQLGDEPFQLHQKFTALQVAVDAARVNGVRQLLQLPTPPEVILLDDAFQHRKIKAGFYVLLTDYSNRYSRDWVLPAGDLREARKGANRADVIIVTKCPADLSLQAQTAIQQELNPMPHQKVYFTCIAYAQQVHGANGTVDLQAIQNPNTTVVAGIARPAPFFKQVAKIAQHQFEFPDHYAFTPKDWQQIKEKAQGAPVITTEKDYVRLIGLAGDYPLYYLPIRAEFISGQQEFDQQIVQYVEAVRV